MPDIRDYEETKEKKALKTGFTDQSHFTNLFKSLIGLTPKSYQKVIKEAGNMEGKV